MSLPESLLGNASANTNFETLSHDLNEVKTSSKVKTAKVVDKEVKSSVNILKSG